MSSVVISGDTSGTITLAAPTVAGSNTLTLPAQTGTVETLGVGTAVATTSGTSVTFTGIPSWAKRITVILQGVSTSGTNNIQLQIGSGSVITTGYSGTSWFHSNIAISAAAVTTGFAWGGSNLATYLAQGIMTIANISGNTWVSSGYVSTSAPGGGGGAGYLALGGTLDRVVLTTVGGTDTFDAGSVNIMWEG